MCGAVQWAAPVLVLCEHAAILIGPAAEKRFQGQLVKRYTWRVFALRLAILGDVLACRFPWDPLAHGCCKSMT